MSYYLAAHEQDHFKEKNLQPGIYGSPLDIQ